MELPSLYWHIRDYYEYISSTELATEGTLGCLMNIWVDEHYTHDDQLFLGIL
jgi:hypothetical protein